MTSRRRSLRTLVPITSWLTDYDWRRDLPRDVVAGVAIAALLVPESMGYADVAGVPAQVGLYAALGAVLVYAVFGRTSVLVVGPASAVAALSASIVAELGGGDDAVAVTVALALLTGVLLVVAGALRLGWIVNFISRPVLEAFVSALSISIIIGQLDGLLGLEGGGESSVAELATILSELSQLGAVALVGVAAVAALLLLERIGSPVPGAVLVVVVAIVVSGVVDLGAIGVETVGEVPRGLPSIGVPELSASRWVDLVGGAAALLLVGFSEGYAAASAVAVETGEEIDPDQELVASGAANIASGLVGGLVVSGSLSKSAAARAAGARTQVAAIVAGALVIAVLLFLAPLVELLPEPVLAAVVVVAVLGTADPRPWVRVREVNRLDFAAAAMTFVLVLVWEALPALLVGVLVSLAFLVRRATFPDVVELRRDGDGTFRAVGPGDDPAQSEVAVVRFEAPLVYANAARLRTAVDTVLARRPRLERVVLDLEMVSDLDATGAEMLEEIDELLAARGVELALARTHRRAAAQVARSRMADRFAGRVHDSIGAAVAVEPPTSS